MVTLKSDFFPRMEVGSETITYNFIQTNMASTDYCGSCGAKLCTKFCVKCGAPAIVKPDNVSVKPSSSTNQQAETTVSLDAFIKTKGKERSGWFNEKSKKKKSAAAESTTDTNSTRSVSIQVGIMTMNEKYHEMKPVRGKKRYIKVKEDASVKDITTAAIETRATYDQFFCAAEDYTLLYPDKTQVTTLLRSDNKKEFKLKHYKKDINKPYSQVVFYLCISHVHTSYLVARLSEYSKNDESDINSTESEDDNDHVSKPAKNPFSNNNVSTISDDENLPAVLHPDVFKLALPDDKSSTITLSHLHQHSSINGQQPTIINQQPSTTIEQQLANDTSTTITPPHINEHSSTINEQQPVTINQQPPITNDQQFVSTSDEQHIPTGTQQQPTSTSSSSQS